MLELLDCFRGHVNYGADIAPSSDHNHWFIAMEIHINDPAIT